MRGPVAVPLVLALGLGALTASGAVSYALQSRRPDGPRSVAEWAARAVRPPGPLPEGRGAELVRRLGCLSCHEIEGRGAHVGPALNGVRNRKTRQEIMTWLGDPQAQKPGTAMPNFGLKETERQLLADYLLKVKE